FLSRSTLRPPSTSTLFPYTTLFRSDVASGEEAAPPGEDVGVGVPHEGTSAHRRAGVQPPVRQGQRPTELPRADAHRSPRDQGDVDRKSTRLNSSHVKISYAVFCLKK